MLQMLPAIWRTAPDNSCNRHVQASFTFGKRRAGLHCFRAASASRMQTLSFLWWYGLRRRSDPGIRAQTALFKPG